MPRIARSVTDVMLGEAVAGTREERLADMLGIASVVANRSALAGVTPQDVVSVRSQFNGYGKALPPGAEAYRDLAEQAWQDVQRDGPIHDATYFATPSASHRISQGKSLVDKTSGHVYYSDPSYSPIVTARGVKALDPSRLPSVAMEAEEALSYAPVPETNPRTAVEAIDSIMTQPAAVTSEQATQAAAQPAEEGVNELGVQTTGDYTSPFGRLGDRITSDFGPRSRPNTGLGRLGSAFHQGVDMSLEPGATGYSVEAAQDGEVTDISYSPGLGNSVTVSHPDGRTTTYGHLSQIGSVNIGDQIARGTPIGSVGNTGNSQADHLHFAMRDEAGQLIDPASVIDFNRDPTVPTPDMLAERQTPDEAVASMFDMGRMGVDPNFDMARFGDQEFDTARFGDPAPSDSAALGFDNFDIAGATRSVPTVSNDPMVAATDQTITTPEQQADMQIRANAARQAIQARAALSPLSGVSTTPETANAAVEPSSAVSALQPTQSLTASATADVQPAQASAETSVSGLDQSVTPDVGKMAEQYGLYGAGKVSPEQNLTADVMDKRLGTKMARVTGAVPETEMATAEPSTVDATPAVETSYDEGVSPARASLQAANAETEAETDETDNRSFGKRMKDSFTNSKTMGGLVGAGIGSLLGGPIAGAALGLAGAKIGDKHFGDKKPSETPLEALANLMTGKASTPTEAGLTDLGSGSAAAYGAWGGSPGTTGVATDGSRITSMGHGVWSRTDPNGVTTKFDKNGNTLGGPGGVSLGDVMGALFGGGPTDPTTDSTTSTTV